MAYGSFQGKDDATVILNSNHHLLNNRLLARQQMIYRSRNFCAVVIMGGVLLTILSMYASSVSIIITNTIVSVASNPHIYQQLVFIGSFTREVSGILVPSYTGKGITVFGLDEKNNMLVQLGSPMMVGDNPSFLFLHPSKPVIYATNELGSDALGKLYSLSFTNSGQITILNEKTTLGYSPSSLSVDPQGKFIAAGFFVGGGGVGIYKLEDDGSLGGLTDFVQWSTKSRVHYVSFDPVEGRYLVVVDFGLDSILSYGFDRKMGKLALINEVQLTSARVGTRYLAWRPDNNNETSSFFVSLQVSPGVARLALNYSTGTISYMETQPLEDCQRTADISVFHEHVFVSCRNSTEGGAVKVIRLNQDGSLSKFIPTSHQTGGSGSRNFKVLESTITSNPFQIFFSNEESSTVTLVSMELDPDNSEVVSHVDVSSPQGIVVKDISEQLDF